jgi:hypothetical protein
MRGKRGIHMSSKLVKNGMAEAGLVAMTDELYLELVITRSGVKLKSPLAPAEICKLLQNVSIDLMFNSLVKVEKPIVQPITM